MQLGLKFLFTAFCLIFSIMAAEHEHMLHRMHFKDMIGHPGEEMKANIQHHHPEITEVHVVPQGSPVTMDFRPDRVRIYVDENGLVVKAPRPG